LVWGLTGYLTITIPKLRGLTYSQDTLKNWGLSLLEIMMSACSKIFTNLNKSLRLNTLRFHIEADNTT
jgi:hypothetical protein